MVDWIIGGIIVAVTILIIVRYVIRLKNGKAGCCDCSGCHTVQCDRMDQKG